jgi:hypothetical protein
MSRFARDNIAGNAGGVILSIFLFPGKVAQWVLYMFPKGNYSAVQHQTRLARSPINTFVFSAAAWLCLIDFVFFRR